MLAEIKEVESRMESYKRNHAEKFKMRAAQRERDEKLESEKLKAEAEEAEGIELEVAQTEQLVMKARVEAGKKRDELRAVEEQVELKRREEEAAGREKLLVEAELEKLRHGFQHRYRELNQRQQQLAQIDPDLQHGRRLSSALENRIESLEDELERLEDDNEALQEQVDRASEAQRDTIHQRGAQLEQMMKKLPMPTIPPKKQTLRSMW